MRSDEIAILILTVDAHLNSIILCILSATFLCFGTVVQRASLTRLLVVTSYSIFPQELFQWYVNYVFFFFFCKISEMATDLYRIISGRISRLRVPCLSHEFWTTKSLKPITPPCAKPSSIIIIFILVCCDWTDLTFKLRIYWQGISFYILGWRYFAGISIECRLAWNAGASYFMKNSG